MDKRAKKIELRVQWFLNLINLDIDGLSDGDRLKWTSEALYMLEFGTPHVRARIYPVAERIYSEDKILQWISEGKLESCQERLRDNFNKLIANIEMRREGLNSSINFISFETKTKVIVQTKVSAAVGKLDDAPFHVSLFSVNDEVSLLLTFFQSFEGISIGSFRKCPECSKWFLHLTKKKKKCCSNGCATRRSSRERREEIAKNDPDLHKKMREDAKERARKSYVGKMKKINPNYIIGKHPKKT